VLNADVAHCNTCDESYSKHPHALPGLERGDLASVKSLWMNQRESAKDP
jgi:hypothetical protein